MAVVTKSLARGSKQCEQSDGKSIQQPKPIPSVRRVDAHRSHPHAKAQVLRIAKPRLNSPAFSIGRHQLFGGIRCRACGQTPGFFHILGVDTDSRPRANANPCPMVFTAKDALLITPSVAFANAAWHGRPRKITCSKIYAC